MQGPRSIEVSIVRSATAATATERPMQPMQGYWLYVNTAETLGSLSA